MENLQQRNVKERGDVTRDWRLAKSIMDIVDDIGFDDLFALLLQNTYEGRQLDELSHEELVNVGTVVKKWRYLVENARRYGHISPLGKRKS